MTNQDNDESLIAHLEALRETLLKCLIVLGLVFPFMLFAAPKVLECLTDIIISDSNVTLNYFSPAEVFIIQIKTAAVLDLIVCFPYIAKKIWDFILPALYENERKFIKTTVLTSTTLFVSGVLFCIFFILPLIIKFGMSFSSSNIKAVFGISNIINLSLWMSISFGLMFQLPLITYSLIKSDIIPYESISDKRSYVIVGILIMAGILTPPDVVSQILLALPTYMLFELGLFFARRK
ncbi:MAG TPA: twin-arginine translocase subunit TatC [Candidatus Adamsella sp.]|nr:twin-arginine translocase subunit TatC [Candidatus Adamsella sp.]